MTEDHTPDTDTAPADDATSSEYTWHPTVISGMSERIPYDDCPNCGRTKLVTLHFRRSSLIPFINPSDEYKRRCKECQYTEPVDESKIAFPPRS